MLCLLHCTIIKLYCVYYICCYLLLFYNYIAALRLIYLAYNHVQYCHILVYLLYWGSSNCFVTISCVIIVLFVPFYYQFILPIY